MMGGVAAVGAVSVASHTTSMSCVRPAMPTYRVLGERLRSASVEIRFDLSHRERGV